MANVKIVTDTNAYFPHPELIAQLGIEVLPLTVRVGQQSYLERVNQLDDIFFRKQAQDPKSASVEAPSATYVHGLFRRLSQGADKILCIHMSSALNDVAEVTRRVADSFVGRQRIVVVDTATTSVGLGLIVEAAAQAAAAGAPIPEILRVVRGMIPRMYALFFSDSLEYLDAWGRLGPAQALLGAMLGLKPLSTMEDGDLLPIEKVRTYSRAVDELYDFIVEFSHIEQMYLLQQDFEVEAAQLLERLELIYPQREFPVISYSPSLAVHIGPKAMGVIVYEGVR